MESQERKSIHPLAAGAAVAVILATGIGGAALMGWLPTSTGQQGEKAALQAPPVKPANQSAYQPGTSNPPVARRTEPVNAARQSEPARAVVPAPVAARCAECGVVESVNMIERKGEGTGLGAVGGAVVGGIVGHEVGGGRGKDVATVAGAVGGGLLGNQIEKKVKSTKVYEITVRLEDGTTRVVTEANPPAWRPGDKVKVINGQIQSNA